MYPTLGVQHLYVPGVFQGGQEVFAPFFKLVVKTAGSGSVTSSPAAIDCGANCSAKVASGTRLTLTAAPAAGQKFTGWGGSCSGTLPTCTVTVNKDTQVQANFK